MNASHEVHIVASDCLRMVLSLSVGLAFISRHVLHRGVVVSTKVESQRQ